LNECHVIAAYILIQTEARKAAIVAAALRDLPGVSETTSLAGPCDVMARAQARDIDELAKQGSPAGSRRSTA
jgi:Lrp/AsnC ligand binding domain